MTFCSRIFWYGVLDCVAIIAMAAYVSASHLVQLCLTQLVQNPNIRPTDVLYVYGKTIQSVGRRSRVPLFISTLRLPILSIRACFWSY